VKKIMLLGFVLCVTCAASSAAAAGVVPQQGDARADVYYRDGARFALAGRLAEAASAFEQAAALDPANGNAYYALGNVYSELGRWADAVNAYYKAISLNKEDVEAYNALGVALGMRGQYEQSAAAFERAIKIYPKWAEPYYNLSQARRRLHEDEGAQAAYKKALRLRPDYAANPPRTFTARRTQPAAPPAGNVLDAMRAVNLGDSPRENVGAPAGVSPAEGARAAGEGPRATGVASGEGARAASATPATPAAKAGGAARNDPPDAKGYYELGVREERAGRHEAAVAALRQAVLMDRRNAAAYLALGDSYAALGRWRESVDAYEQAARLSPDDAETYRRLGRAYAKLREASPEASAAEGAADAASQSAPHSNAAAVGVKPSADTNSDAREAAKEGRTTKADARAGAAGSEVAARADDQDPTAVYRVGPGDVLDVRVLDGRAQRTTSYEVTPTGLLAYASLAEPLKVAGLTTGEVASLLGARLKLRAGGADPEVAVGVRQYASHAIIVSGLVKEAGTKFLQREGVPLYVVVAYAQPLPTAAQAVVVSRVTGRTTEVELSDDRAMKMLVRPGDVVTVRARPARPNEARK
jgi:tetratricopeptide (TPR) repeat protein/protein involved in polysaccharide export with SLBB domain